MAGRSLKGHVAHISTGFLRLVNMIVVAGAVATIVILFVIEHYPSMPAGWGFIVLGALTVISGIFGTISSGQWGCFGCHLLVLLLSTAGLCAGFLIIFLKLNVVLDGLNNKISHSEGKNLLRVEGALYFILFCCQLVILLLACLIQSCGFVDYYEDLEANTPANLKKLARQQAKEEAESEKRRSKIEATSAHQLREKMAQKYGKFSNDPMYSDSEH